MPRSISTGIKEADEKIKNILAEIAPKEKDRRLTEKRAELARTEAEKKQKSRHLLKIFLKRKGKKFIWNM